MHGGNVLVSLPSVESDGRIIRNAAEPPGQECVHVPLGKQISKVNAKFSSCKMLSELGGIYAFIFFGMLFCYFYQRFNYTVLKRLCSKEKYTFGGHLLQLFNFLRLFITR